MNKVEIILFMTATVSLIATMVIHKENESLKNANKIKVHTCKYNENPHCYERACGYCSSKKECDICCGGKCNKCTVHNVEYFEKG